MHLKICQGSWMCAAKWMRDSRSGPCGLLQFWLTKWTKWCETQGSACNTNSGSTTLLPCHHNRSLHDSWVTTGCLTGGCFIYRLECWNSCGEVRVLDSLFSYMMTPKITVRSQPIETVSINIYNKSVSHFTPKWRKKQIVDRSKPLMKHSCPQSWK